MFVIVERPIIDGQDGLFRRIILKVFKRVFFVHFGCVEYPTQKAGPPVLAYFLHPMRVGPDLAIDYLAWSLHMCLLNM